MTLRDDYQTRYDQALSKAAINLETLILEYLEGEPGIDRVNARAKSVDRFMSKAEKENNDGTVKYSDPLNQIQDQIGARIIAFYLQDVERVKTIIHKYFRPVEEKRVVPDENRKFGYFGYHFVLLTPSDIAETIEDPSLVPQFFELQIKTLFQHAWSEAEHDLGYKPGQQPLTDDEDRRFAFASAQAWGADRIFSELLDERSDGNGDNTGKR